MHKLKSMEMLRRKNRHGAGLTLNRRVTASP
jgi:hypothetical protein